MHYGIYIPGAGGYGDHLADANVGLEALLDDHCNPSWQDLPPDDCPDRAGGVFAIWDQPDRPGLRIAPNIEWHGAKPDPERNLEANRFYIAINPDEPPTPSDLLRESNLGGVPVGLCDGFQWTIPVVRDVPRDFTLNDDGAPVAPVKSKYEWFFDRSNEYCKMFADFLAETSMAGETDQIAKQFELGLDGWKFIWTAIGYNYRLCGEIGWVLNLLDDKTFFDLISATFDVIAFNEFCEQKKKELDTAAREQVSTDDGLAI